MFPDLIDWDKLFGQAQAAELRGQPAPPPGPGMPPVNFQPAPRTDPFAQAPSPTGNFSTMPPPSGFVSPPPPQQAAPQPAQRRPAPPRSLASMPTQPAQATPSPMGPSAAEPWRQKQYEIQNQVIDATKMPDMTGQADAYRRRWEAAGPDMAMAMFLGHEGGAMGKEMGGQVLKNALAARQPHTDEYGTMDYEGGFTANPMKQRAFEIERLEKRGALYEKIAHDAGTEEERRRAAMEAERSHRMAEQMRMDTLRHQNAVLGETGRHNRALEDQGHYLPIKDADGTISAVLDTKKGTIVDRGAGGGGGAPGTPGERFPKLNDSQGKAVAFGMRAAEAHQILDSIGSGYSPGSVAVKGGLEQMPFVGGLAGGLYNMTMGGPEQQVEQAQRNFINAILRRESGAVISPSEFANARQQYFPQPGDDPALLEQKRQNRETSIRGLTIESGPGARYVQEKNVPQQQAPSALPKTRLGRDVQGYKDKVRGFSG